MEKLPTVMFKGTFLELRNAALLLGRKENWTKRLVTAAFGEDICEIALAANEQELKLCRKLLSTYFESKFTAKDKAMEIAIKKAEDRIINDLPYEDEDDI